MSHSRCAAVFIAGSALLLSGCNSVRPTPPASSPLLNIDQIENHARLFLPKGYTLIITKDCLAPRDWMPGDPLAPGIAVQYQPYPPGRGGWGVCLTFMPTNYNGTHRPNEPSISAIPTPDRELGSAGPFRVFSMDLGTPDDRVSVEKLATHFGVTIRNAQENTSANTTPDGIRH